MAQARQLADLEDGAKRAIVGRVAESATLRKAPRLRQLFLYLCERALENPAIPIKENQVGNEVFGRQPDYDTSQDTIVRVQISQLRRKLQLYFLSEGISEPVVIELPKGSYTPVFHAREGWKSEPPRRVPRRRLIGVAAAVAALIAALALASLYSTRGDRSALARYWRRAFLNGNANYLVLSDGNLLQLTDILNRPVGLQEYRSHVYPAFLVDTIEDPGVRAHTRRLMSTFMTSLQDAGALRQLVLLGARLGVSWNVTSARDYRPPRSAGNLVIIGHRKANPWVELYESRMNFRYQWLGDRRVARILNQAPLRGEQPFYEVVWAQRGYALIAYLKPGPEDSSVLILAGTDLMSTEASARTMAEEAALSRLLEGMGIAAGEPVPPFEALLRTELLSNAPTDSRLIAWRVHRKR